MNYVYFCGHDRNGEINTRMYERNIPSHTLQAQFSNRPISTKYDMMPILDRRALPTVPVIRQPAYNVSNTFNPGNDAGPWSGYASNINDESRIRNQFFARQECGQGIYIPSTTSDLYEVKVVGRQEQQPFPDLFSTPDLQPFNPNPFGLGKNFFDNCTRQQIKSIPTNLTCQ